MPNIGHLLIGTRGSRLSLAQTDLVIQALERARSGIVIEKKVITTTGDINQSPIPLDTIGKAWFTGEIEQALINGDIHIAVHSLKDLPPDLPPDLAATAVLKREDPADVLVSKSGLRLKDLREHAVVGTDSLRRKALLLDERPDLIVRSIRGNIDTRLKKLNTEDYDAIVIAAAGLNRLDLNNLASERFDPAIFLPAPGQGILAAEIHSNNAALGSMLSAIVHPPTALASHIEQAFSRAAGGGCKLPIGCYARVDGNKVDIYGSIGTPDGTSVIRRSSSGPSAEGLQLASNLAAECLSDPAIKI